MNKYFWKLEYPLTLNAFVKKIGSNHEKKEMINEKKVGNKILLTKKNSFWPLEMKKKSAVDGIIMWFWCSKKRVR